MFTKIEIKLHRKRSKHYSTFQNWTFLYCVGRSKESFKCFNLLSYAWNSFNFAWRSNNTLKRWLLNKITVFCNMWDVLIPRCNITMFLYWGNNRHFLWFLAKLWFFWNFLKVYYFLSIMWNVWKLFNFEFLHCNLNVLGKNSIKNAVSKNLCYHFLNSC